MAIVVDTISMMTLAGSVCWHNDGRCVNHTAFPCLSL